MNKNEPQETYVSNENKKSIAEKLNIEYEEWMQDWPYEVADDSRIDDFLRAYKERNTSTLEKLILGKILFQSFEESETYPLEDARWQEFIKLLREDFEIHLHTIWYWSSSDQKSGQESWNLSHHMKNLLDRNLQS